MDMILQGFITLASSFVGTLGFAIFMHAPRKAWLPASAIGGVAYLLYWVLLQFGLYEPIAIFVGAFLGSILGQYCARRMQMIASIFVLLSMIPLVPGLGLYRCMELLARQTVQKLEGDEGQKHIDEYADSKTERGKCLLKSICEKFGFDSLGYQTLDGLLEAIGIDRDKVCTYCWTGKE